MRRVVATVGHEIPERPPLQLETGDTVDVGEFDTEWPEFALVTAAHGSGWVPCRHLSVVSGPGVSLTAYDTAELPTAAGDRLVVVSEDLASGWLWCRSINGREGWVPAKTTRNLGDEGPVV